MFHRNRLELICAAGISMGLFVWITLEYVFGVHSTHIQYHPLISAFALFVPIIGLAIGMWQKRERQLGGHITYKAAFRVGMMISLFTAIFSIPAQLIFHTLVNPDFFSAMLSFAEMRAKTIYTDATQLAEVLDKQRRYFTLRSYIVQSASASLVGGAFFSLILARIFRRR